MLEKDKTREKGRKRGRGEIMEKDGERKEEKER